MRVSSISVVDDHDVFVYGGVAPPIRSPPSTRLVSSMTSENMIYHVAVGLEHPNHSFGGVTLIPVYS